MSAIKSMVYAMFDDMLGEYGITPENARAFKPDETIEDAAVRMLWNIGVTAVDYGFRKGLSIAGIDPETLEVQLLNGQMKEDNRHE